MKAFLVLASVGALGYYLSRHMNPRETLVSRAVAELAKWRGLTETDPEARQHLERYWAAVGLPLQPPEELWSAAFISEIGRGILTPSLSHVGYLHAALGKVLPITTPVRRGDIVVKTRNGATPEEFRQALENGIFIPTHGDVVVAVAGGKAKAIGGNKRNAVASENIPLNPQTGAIDLPEYVAILRV